MQPQTHSLAAPVAAPVSLALLLAQLLQCHTMHLQISVLAQTLLLLAQLPSRL
jgi:hypothetical protein